MTLDRLLVGRVEDGTIAISVPSGSTFAIDVADARWLATRLEDELDTTDLSDDRDEATGDADGGQDDDEETFECEQCGREFDSERGMNIHIARTHDNGDDEGDENTDGDADESTGPEESDDEDLGIDNDADADHRRARAIEKLPSHASVTDLEAAVIECATPTEVAQELRSTREVVNPIVRALDLEPALNAGPERARELIDGQEAEP